jgi:hypothetical protein
MDSLLLTYSDTIQEWYIEHYDIYGPLIDIENKLAIGEFENAQSLISSFQPESNVQANYKNFFQLYHNFAATDSLVPSDSSSLYILSNQCPGKDGPSIYKARSLYNLIYTTVLQFNDDSCETIGYSMRTGRNLQDEQKDKSLLEFNEKNQIKKKQKNDLKIYPNPSQNTIYLTGKKLCQNCQIIITDINGRILQTEKLTSSAGTLSISFNLDNGIYFVNLIDETGYSTVKKFIVAK